MDKGWGLTLDSDSLGSFLLNKNKRTHDRMFPGIHFPVALGRGDEQAAPQPSDENRAVVDEVDFFADKNRLARHEDDAHDDSKTMRVLSVKKENPHGEGASRPDLDVNVRTPIRFSYVSLLVCVLLLVLFSWPTKSCLFSTRF